MSKTKSKTKIFFVGVNGEEAVDSKTTQKQIAEVQELECSLLNPKNREPLTWIDVNNEAEPRTIFQAILSDRKTRIDEHNLMADRPSFCVITAVDGRAVRLEFYEGHDALSLVYDVRAAELFGKELPKFLENDPNAYNPAEFLEKALGIPQELSKPCLKILHEDKED